MNNLELRPGDSVADALDAALNALRAEPLFWRCSLEAALQRLFSTAASVLEVAQITLYQSGNNQTTQTRYTYPTTIDAANTDSSPGTAATALRAPVSVAGAHWGELAVYREQPASWSLQEKRCATTLTDLVAQVLLQLDVAHIQQRFESLTENAPIAVMQLDENLQVLYRNRQLIDLLGGDFSNLSIPIWTRFQTAESNSDATADFETLASQGQAQNTYRVERPDGSHRHVLWHAVTEQRGANKHAGGFIAIGIDISEQWQAQQQLRELLELQRAMIDNSPTGIITTDCNGIVTLFNAAAEHLLGYRADEVIGQSGRMLHHPEDVLRIHRWLQRQKFSADIYGFVEQAQREGKYSEWNYVHKDGSYVAVQATTTTLRGPNGELRGYMAAITDLRERERLAVVGDRTHLLIKHLNRGINAAIGEQFFEHLIAELRGALQADHLNILELIPGQPELRARPLTTSKYEIPDGGIELAGTALEAVLRQGQKIHLSDVQRLYPGRLTSHIFEMIAVPLISSDGAVLGTLVAAHDKAFAEPQLIENLLEIFAIRASIELERLRSARAQRARDAEQAWLYEASQRIHACLGVADIAHAVVDALATHHSAPRVSFAINEGSTYRIVAYAGSADKIWKQTVYPREPNLFGPVIHAKNSILLFPDFLEAAHSGMNAPEFAEREMRSVALIGLIDHGHDIGAITLEYSSPTALKLLDLDVLGTFGRTVTLALGRTQHREQLEYQASHDALTGLPNRAALHREFERWQQRNAHSTALLLLDLDRFKDINDTLGHHVGDALLLQIGERLRTGLNGCEATLSRLGGDEFAVLLNVDSISAEAAQSIAQTVQVEIRRPFHIDTINLEVGVSIGVAIFPEHGADSHALLRSADVAMYAAKSAGGGVAIYNRALDLNSPERLALMTELNSSIRDGELQLFYQPKIDLSNGEIIGFEGLLRWQHPRLGLLTPAQFLPLIEMSDSIHELTYRVLELAALQLKTWIDAGKNWDLSINLSARNLIDDRIVLHLAEQMRKHQLPPDRLELEITESALIVDPQQALQLLGRMAAIGARLSIDDFGIGYSSMSYLRQMPIAALKIDRSFICNIVDNAQDQLIVHSIVKLAHSLNLLVVAEGVEGEGVAACLRAMACDQAQGFHFSKALPIHELNQWLARRSISAA